MVASLDSDPFGINAGFLNDGMFDIVDAETRGSTPTTMEFLMCRCPFPRVCRRSMSARR